MHKVLDDTRQILLSLSVGELRAIEQAVRDAIESASLDEAGFAARYGMPRDAMRACASAMKAEAHPTRRVDELVQAWEDQGGVMVRVMNTFGDPVELGQLAAATLAHDLGQAIKDSTATD
jgi:hypothetical protein